VSSIFWEFNETFSFHLVAHFEVFSPCATPHCEFISLGTWMELLVLIWLHIRSIVHLAILLRIVSFFFLLGELNETLSIWTVAGSIKFPKNRSSSEGWESGRYKKNRKKRSVICFQFSPMDFTFLVSFQNLTKIRYQNRILFWNQILKGTSIKDSWKLYTAPEEEEREVLCCFDQTVKPTSSQTSKQAQRGSN
jgi:hypothetical protein